MNVNLTPALERLVHGKVKTGRYNSANEVVREALRLMEQRDEDRQRHLTDLRTHMDASLTQAARGHYVDGETFMNTLIAEVSAPAPRRRKAS